MGWNNLRIHGRARCQGIKDVISYSGITGTPDHLVRTDQGWQTLAEANRRQLRVAKSGSGGNPIRFFDDCFSKNEWVSVEYPRVHVSVSEVPAEEHMTGSTISRSVQTQRLALIATQDSLWMCLTGSTPGRGARTAMQQPQNCRVSELWGERDSIQIRWCESGGTLDSRKPGDPGRQEPPTGQDQQRWALRTGKFEVVNCEPEHGPYSDKKLNCSVATIQATISQSDVCRCDVEKHAGDGPDVRANSREVQPTIVQAQGEVWDILDCGPLHRFTANGALVHNCILDHSGVVRHLGFPWDYFGQHLDDGKPKESDGSVPEKPEPLPKPCPQCHFMKPPKTAKCPACGFEAMRPDGVTVDDGELVPVTKEVRGIPALKTLGRETILAQLRGYQLAHSYSDGWTKHKYKTIFDCWPRSIQIDPVPPEGVVLSWLRSEQIKWAKSKNTRTFIKPDQDGFIVDHSAPEIIL